LHEVEINELLRSKYELTGGFCDLLEASKETQQAVIEKLEKAEVVKIGMIMNDKYPKMLNQVM